VVLKHASLRQMHLAVFVRAALRTSAHSVRSAVSATGLGGVVGNKGGLAISFHLGTTSLAFVSCHLAAHDHKNRERNEMCKEILSETAGAIGEQRRAARGRLDVASQFDHCFWFGDLNYRVDLKLGQQAAGLPAEALKEHEAHHAAVRDLVEEEDWEALWEADQLRHSQRAGDVLARFSEGQYSFPPTFKVLRQRGAHYKQQRIPSYCDRILWRSMPGRGSSAVTQTSLAAVPGVSTSDHKPVFATFEVAASARLHGAAGSIRAQHEATATTCARLGSLSLQGIIPADLSGRSDPYIAFFTNPPGLLGGPVPTSSVKKGVLATGAPGAGEGGQQGAREPNSSTHSTRDRRDRRGEGVARRDGRLGARPVGWLRGRGRRRYVQLVRGGAASAALLVLARRLAACHAHPGCLRPRHRLEGRPARR